MLWTAPGRRCKVARGGTVVLAAEVRNRDTLSARYDKLRVVASPALQVWVEPPAGLVPATGSVRLQVHIRGLRVGFHGIHGLALEVRGAPGLFEVPLTFANPYGVEVVPRALKRVLTVPLGGRSEVRAAAGRGGRRRGDGSDFRELRGHQPGDAFRRIAWKASARRGKLVVREFEREEHDVVVLVLDASSALWSGHIGGSALDQAVDAVASLASHHSACGAEVGLQVIASRRLAVVKAGRGRAHLALIADALMQSSAMHDADRCGWDAEDWGWQVAEHARPSDAQTYSYARRGKWAKLVRRVEPLLEQAPFSRPPPLGYTEVDARLRHYGLCFGMFAPAKSDSDPDAAGRCLLETLAELRTQKKGRASVVHVVAPVPPKALLESLRTEVKRLKRKRIQLVWTLPPREAMEAENPLRPPVGAAMDSFGGAPAEEGDAVVHGVVRSAIVLRSRAAEASASSVLKKLGIKVLPPSKLVPKRRSRSMSQDEAEKVA